jgi:hypothetical protein
MAGRTHAVGVVASAVLAGTLAATLAGCGGSSTPAAGASPSLPTVTPCPSVTAAAAPWPRGVPADLPKPPGAVVRSQQTTAAHVHVVRLSTPLSLRDSVLFVLRRLPKAGYVLGHGDAEPDEADVPFARGDLRGQLKLTAVSACRTDWLLATVAAGASSGTSPLLSPNPSESPSSLPFH